MNEFEKRMRDKIKNKKPFTPKETKGDKLRKDFSKKKKTFESPMKMERKKALKKAAKMALKALTPLKSGGRAGLRGGGICKKGMNRKAVGKNS